MSYLPSNLRAEAHDAAKALTESRYHFGAAAYELAGEMYVVAFGGELDTAYTVHDAGRLAKRADKVEPVVTLAVAVNYYMRTGRRLGVSEHFSALSDAQIEVLALARTYQN